MCEVEQCDSVGYGGRWVDLVNFNQLYYENGETTLDAMIMDG